jgi:Fe-S cluster assembly protein SufD
MSALWRAALDWVGRPPADGPLAELRRRAALRFRAAEIPTRRDEAWRFTPLDALLSIPFEPAPVRFARVTTAGGVELLEPERAPDEIGSLAGGEEPRPFVDLNTALFEDALVVRIPAGAEVEAPVEVVVGSGGHGGPTAAHPRILVLAGPGSRVVLVETYRGEGTYLANAVTEVHAGAGAVLDHVRVQNEGPDGFHLGALAVRVEKGASYRSRVVSLGARLARLDLDVVLCGEGAECVLDGLYVAAGDQIVDHHTSLDHQGPRATSLERYKGILAGAGRAVFDGAIRVRRDAQQTNAHQENRNLLLSAEAVVNTKPSLRIDADDVKCSHGATVGQLDDDALFYLRTRGIAHGDARAILTYGFAQEVLERIPLSGLRRRLAAEALSRLSCGASPGDLP